MKLSLGRLLPPTILAVLSLTLLHGAVPLEIEVPSPGPDGSTAWEDEALDVPFTITSAASGNDPVQVEASVSGGKALQPRLDVVLDGTRGRVRVRLGPNHFGRVVISLRARNWRSAGPVSIVDLNWRGVEDDPVLLPLPDVILTEGQPAPYLPITIVDPESAAPARLSWNASRPGVVDTIEFLGEGMHRHAKLNLIPGAVGALTVRIGVTESGPTQWSPFQLAVRPRSFLPGTGGAGSLLQSFAAWADLNADGRMDLLPLGTNAGPQTVRMNVGEAQWPSSDLLISLSLRRLQQAYHVAWTDFDGDNLPDGMFSWFVRPMLALNRTGILGTRPRVETWLTNAIPELQSSESAWGDLDGDGDSDLVLTGIVPTGRKPMLTVARNESGTNLTTVSTGLPSVQGPVVVADFDNDGRPDVLVCNPSLNQPGRVWLNRGDFSFEASPLVLASSNVLAAGALDLNGDGRFDVWTVERSWEQDGSGDLQGRLVLYVQTRAGLEISQTWEDLDYSNGFDPAWADFDADGDLDLVAPGLSEQIIYNSTDGQIPPDDNPVIGRTSVFMLYLNDGTGQFQRDSFVSGMISYPNPSHSYATPGPGVAAADVNRDGAVDLWVPALNRNGPNSILTNASRVLNLLPSDPGHPTAVVVGRSVHFQWSAADDWNQTSPLTYNLRVGSRPGGNDIIPSLSLSDGTRLVPAVGNCGLVTFHTLLLRETAPATLYWAVQAVDHSFEGGPWSEEQVLQLDGLGAPSVRLIPHRLDEVFADVSGRPHSQIRIQQSADLNHWTEAGSASLDAAGFSRVPVVVASGSAVLYLRAVQVE